jgi:hypothetical protein
VSKHRRPEGYGSRTDPTQILPALKQLKRRTVSPLLLGAGALAVALVLGVGGWALMGSRSSGDPLVFPWSGDSPGAIDVSVSMEPTTDPVLASEDPSPSRKPSRTSPKLAATMVPKDPSPSRSTASLATTLSAAVTGVSGWDGNVMVTIDVKNNGTIAADTWTVELWFDKDVKPNPPWNASVQVISSRHLKFTAERPLRSGDTVRFGFIATFSGWTQPRLQTCQLGAQPFSCSER